MIAAPILLGLAPLLASIRDEGDLRVEHFVLERPSAESSTEPVEVGLACLRRRPVEGESAGHQLELECVFRRQSDDDEDEHVLHVERSGPGPALVWREWGPRRSRCLTAERTKEGTGLVLVESSRGGIPRETLAAPADFVLPLELLELAREGKAASGRFTRLDPLSRALEPIDVRTLPGDLRVVELTREDGSAAGRFEFRGTELVGFQWQDGDLRARRITSESYARRVAAAAPLVRRP
jgi:hypothetical protein